MLTFQTVSLLNRFIAAGIAYFLITMISGFVQAWIAKKLGDTTAEHAGFLSFNPAVYIDWVGFLLFLITGFGWGTIVPINPLRFSGRYKRFEFLFAYASRSMVNFALGIITLFVLDACFGGYLLSLPVPIFFARHPGLVRAMRMVLILMTTFSIFFSLYTAMLMLCRVFILQVLPTNMMRYEAEFLATMAAIFMLIFFANQLEYVLNIIIIYNELLLWYFWRLIASSLGFISWYRV